MLPITVPAAPRSAYNPNRRVSDLILGQLKHFQHVHTKRGGLGIPPALARDIYTEAGAARYIAAITSALRASAPAAKLTAVPASGSKTKAVPTGLALAASATTEDAAKKAPPASRSAKPAAETVNKAAQKTVKRKP